MDWLVNEMQVTWIAVGIPFFTIFGLGLGCIVDDPSLVKAGLGPLMIADCATGSTGGGLHESCASCWTERP